MKMNKYVSEGKAQHSRTTTVIVALDKRFKSAYTSHDSLSRIFVRAVRSNIDNRNDFDQIMVTVGIAPSSPRAEAIIPAKSLRLP